MRTWVLAAVLALIASAPVFYLVYYYQSGRAATALDLARPDLIEFSSLKPPTLEQGATLGVKACSVVDGHRLELYLEGGYRIRGHLPTATKDGANEFVVDLLKNNANSPPTVTLLRQIDDYWIVQLYVNRDGKREKLVDLLKNQSLLLD